MGEEIDNTSEKATNDSEEGVSVIQESELYSNTHTNEMFNSEGVSSELESLDSKWLINWLHGSKELVESEQNDKIRVQNEDKKSII